MPRTFAQAIGFLLGLWIAFFLSPFGAPASGESLAPGGTEQAIAMDLFGEVNRVRADHHLVRLQRRADLDAIAQAHSEDMARRGYFDHHNPEGQNPLDRIQATRIEGMTLAAENLGKTTRRDPAHDVVKEWLLSPDHRRNLLAPPFNATGIGVATSPTGALVVTQIYVSIPN